MEGTPIPPPLPSSDPALARSKVQAPAILLIVMGALGLIASLWGFMGHSADQYGPLVNNSEVPEGMRNLGSFMANNGRWLNLPNILLSGLTLFGGLKMKELRAYPLALTAAIITLIPCLGPNTCCCIAIPVGIWALVVLMRPEVKGAFGP